MKNVLVLGAGMVARPLVRYLLERGLRLVQADIEPRRAEAMIDGHPNGRATSLDMQDAKSLAALVGEADLVVAGIENEGVGQNQIRVYLDYDVSACSTPSPTVLPLPFIPAGLAAGAGAARAERFSPTASRPSPRERSW